MYLGRVCKLRVCSRPLSRVAPPKAKWNRAAISLLNGGGIPSIFAPKREGPYKADIGSHVRAFLVIVHICEASASDIHTEPLPGVGVLSARSAKPNVLLRSCPDDFRRSGV